MNARCFFGLTLQRFSVMGMALVAVALLQACNHMPQENPQRAVEPNRVEMRLAEAADRATKSLEVLASVEKSRSPAPIVDKLDNVPAELMRTVTVQWVGPIGPLAQRLADRAGYRFNEIGARPPVALIVSVDAVNRPVIDVLRDAALQLGGRATMVVDGTQRLVEVRYAPIDG